MISPFASKIMSFEASVAMLMTVFSSLASDIWVARVRPLIRAYNFRSKSLLPTDSFSMWVGRMASWASWALADLVL